MHVDRSTHIDDVSGTIESDDDDVDDGKSVVAKAAAAYESLRLFHRQSYDEDDFVLLVLKEENITFYSLKIKQIDNRKSSFFFLQNSCCLFLLNLDLQLVLGQPTDQEEEKKRRKKNNRFFVVLIGS